MIQCKCGFSYPDYATKCAICGQSFSHLHNPEPPATSTNHRVAILVDGKSIVDFSTVSNPSTVTEIITLLTELNSGKVVKDTKEFLF